MLQLHVFTVTPLRLPYFLRFEILFGPCSQACGDRVVFAIDSGSHKLDILFDGIYLWNWGHHIPMAPHTERIPLNSDSESLGWI